MIFHFAGMLIIILGFIIVMACLEDLTSKRKEEGTEDQDDMLFYLDEFDEG